MASTNVQSKDSLKRVWRQKHEQSDSATTKNDSAVTEADDATIFDHSTDVSLQALDDDDDLFNDEKVVDERVVMSAARPLLLSLRIAGLYFKPHSKTSNSNKQQHMSSQRCLNNETNQQRKLDIVERTYATLVLALLWINVARIFTLFNGSESFNKTLILKLSIASSMLLSAILQTSLYHASVTGKLEHIFRQLRTTAYLARMMRCSATIRTAWIWLLFVVYYTFFVIYLFNGDETLDVYLAPFVTLIPLTGIGLTVVKIVLSIVCVFIVLSWLLPLSTTQLVADTLRYQFQFLNRQFRRAIDDSRHAIMSTVT
jgi:hypothetical protein